VSLALKVMSAVSVQDPCFPKPAPEGCRDAKMHTNKIYRFDFHVCSGKAISVPLQIPSHPNKHIFKLKVTLL